MRRLRQADLGHGRHDHAPLQAAADHLVLGGLSDGDPFQRHLGAATATPTRSRLLQDGVAAVRQAAPQHGRRTGRSALAGLVEVDETEIACRSKHDPVTGGGGRSHQGKMLIVGAVEVQDAGAGPGRIRLAEVSDYSANSLHPFVTPKSRARGYRQDRRMVRLSRALLASTTIPTSSARWPPISCCRGCTGSSPTSKYGVWASIMACAASISNPTSTSSSSASTAVRTRHAAFRSLLGIAAGTRPSPFLPLMLISPEAGAQITRL